MLCCVRKETQWMEATGQGQALQISADFALSKMQVCSAGGSEKSAMVEISHTNKWNHLKSARNHDGN